MKLDSVGEFKKIELDDKKIFLNFFEKYPQKFCDYNLFNLLSWSVVYEYFWTIYKDRLLIYNKTTDYIFKPLGENFSVEELVFISDSFKKSGLSGNFCFFDIEYIKFLSEDLEKFYNLIEARDNSNYIYLTEKLAQLKGRNLHNKRNLISQFIRNYPDFVVISSEKDNLNCENFKECVNLAEKWAIGKEIEDNTYQKQIEIELNVLKNSCNYFKHLDVSLIIIKVKDKIAAFSVYSKQNEEMAVVHFEKYDKNFIGVAQMINNVTAKHLIGRYKFINREDDLGIPTLRFSKNSYYPEFLLTPYLLIRK